MRMIHDVNVTTHVSDYANVCVYEPLQSHTNKEFRKYILVKNYDPKKAFLWDLGIRFGKFSIVNSRRTMRF